MKKSADPKKIIGNETRNTSGRPITVNVDTSALRIPTVINRNPENEAKSFIIQN